LVNLEGRWSLGADFRGVCNKLPSVVQGTIELDESPVVASVDKTLGTKK